MSRMILNTNEESDEGELRDEVLEKSADNKWRINMMHWYEYENKKLYPQGIYLQHMCPGTDYIWCQPQYLDLGCSHCGPPPPELYEKWKMLTINERERAMTDEPYPEPPKIYTLEEHRELKEIEGTDPFQYLLQKKGSFIYGASKSTYPILPTIVHLYSPSEHEQMRQYETLEVLKYKVSKPPSWLIREGKVVDENKWWNGLSLSSILSGWKK